MESTCPFTGIASVNHMYTYGPVASWRYGRSLGIDATVSPKKCTFNCVYCQLGPTKKHIISPEMVSDDIPPSKDIVKEVGDTLERLDRGTVDVVTFSGSGEPTLNPNIGVIESEIRNIVEDLPVILLTNASLLPRRDIRKGVLNFDIITAKYDAGDEDTFKRINRPAKGIFTLHEIHNGIKQLHGEMKGVLALEVMLLRGAKGLTNVEGAPRKALIEGIIELNPDVVQIYTPWRPAAVQTVRPVSHDTLTEFGQDLEEHLNSEKLWIYGVHDARNQHVKWKARHILEQEILELLKRRPCRVSDICITLGVISSIVSSTMDRMTKNEQVKTSMVGNELFYGIGGEEHR